MGPWAWVGCDYEGPLTADIVINGKIARIPPSEATARKGAKLSSASTSSITQSQQRSARGGVEFHGHLAEEVEKRHLEARAVRRSSERRERHPYLDIAFIREASKVLMTPTSGFTKTLFPLFAPHP